MNNNILASQGMMQRSSMGSPDVIMARRVMGDESCRTASGRKNSRVQKEEDGIHRLCTQARGLVTSKCSSCFRNFNLSLKDPSPPPYF